MNNPVSVEFGPNGEIYVLEYGPNMDGGNSQARLSRLDYIGNACGTPPSSVKQARRGQIRALPNIGLHGSKLGEKLNSNSMIYTLEGKQIESLSSLRQMKAGVLLEKTQP